MTSSFDLPKVGKRIVPFREMKLDLCSNWSLSYSFFSNLYWSNTMFLLNLLYTNLDRSIFRRENGQKPLNNSKLWQVLAFIWAAGLPFWWKIQKKNFSKFTLSLQFRWNCCWLGIQKSKKITKLPETMQWENWSFFSTFMVIFWMCSSMLVFEAFAVKEQT